MAALALTTTAYPICEVGINVLLEHKHFAVAGLSVVVIVPVILAGGQGTRLWPLSRSARPKQFIDLVGETSLFQQTLERVKDAGR